MSLKITTLADCLFSAVAEREKRVSFGIPNRVGVSHGLLHWRPEGVTTRFEITGLA